MFPTSGRWPSAGGWILALAIFVLPLSQPAGEALAKTLAKPLDRHGSLIPRYNFPPPSRGDRFAPRGLVLKQGIKGWARYGHIIKAVAKQEKVDPYVIGAYIWVESNFDPHQDYAADDHLAIGLGSVQPADYHWRYTERQLMDPWLNVILTSREFKSKWRPHDMGGTVMDVWYPQWRRRVAHGQRIPIVHFPEVYIQAVANRYYALKDIDEHLVVKPKLKPKPKAKPKPGLLSLPKSILHRIGVA